MVLNSIKPYDSGDGLKNTEAWSCYDGSVFSANENDIIQWDGQKWNVIFDSRNSSTSYVSNIKTGIQYMWNGSEWKKSFEGIYEALNWRLVL